MTMLVMFAVVAVLVVLRLLVPEFGGYLDTYINYEAIAIVFGGIFVSALIFIPFDDLFILFKLLLKRLKGPSVRDMNQAIKSLVQLSTDAQMHGKRQVSANGSDIDEFLERGIELISAHMSSDFIRKTLENEILEMRRRHMKYIGYLRTLGSLAPMFGLIGTVVGIIQVLKNMSDPSTIGASMALALITTLYGLLLASLMFLPFAKKLEMVSERESQLKEIIMEGIIMIEDDIAPSNIEHFLTGFIKTLAKRKV